MKQKYYIDLWKILTKKKSKYKSNRFESNTKKTVIKSIDPYGGFCFWQVKQNKSSKR